MNETETIEVIRQDVTTGQEEDKIRDLVIGLTLTSSYWGYLLTRIKRISDNTLPFLMGVGSKIDSCEIQLFYNKELVDATKDSVVLLCLKHEGLHILNRHVPRFLRIVSKDLIKKEDYQFYNFVFNLASDMVVNEQLSMPRTIEVAGKEAKLVHFEDFGFKPGREVEYYYYELLKKDETKKMFQSWKGLQLFIPCGHEDWIKGCEHIPDLSAFSRKMEQRCQEVIKESYKNMSSSARGTLPAFIQELIRESLEPPKLPYYQLIRKLVKGSKLTKFKQSCTRINRKRTYLFSLSKDGTPKISPFPGKVRDFSFKIGVLLDTSGSMSSDDILEGLKGVRNIIENDKYCKTIVIECDTDVRKMYEVRKLRDISYKITGRGGTILLPALKKFKELNVDVVLAFTDGYIDNINGVDRKELPKKLIWVIPEDGRISCVNRTGFIVRYKRS